MCKGAHRKRWSLQINGDLNRILISFIIKKGPNAVDFTTVKGRSREEHIANGLTTQAHKEGNDGADEAAEEGQDQHGNDAANLAKWLQERQKQLDSFMKGVQTILIAMLHEDKRPRHEKCKFKHPFGGKKPQRLCGDPKLSPLWRANHRKSTES